MKCKICQSESDPFARATIVRKHEIQYYRCPACGFVQTEAPYWLPEVYANPLQKDTGTVRRTLIMGEKTAAILRCLFNPAGTFVDFGGGDGMFVRHMRDIGYDFYWRDKYATNIFAFGFEAPPANRFDLATAFEVFEHLPDPMPEIRAMAALSDNIFFTTGIYPDHGPKPEEWGYFSLHGGQHIALYSKRSLELVADQLGLHFQTDGRAVHLFSKKPVNALVFRLITRGKVSRAIRALFPRVGLTERDYAEAIRG